MKPVIALISLMVATQLGYSAESVESLIDQLNKPSAPAQSGERKTRSFGNSGNANTFVDTAQATCLFTGAPSAGSVRAATTRSLYVTEAPRVDLDVQFAYDSSTLLEPAKATLQTLAQALNSAALRNQAFIVAGHTDRLGSAQYNRQLSCARANAVAQYLVSEGGVDAQRLTLFGFGFDRLKNTNDPHSEVNRRVEIQRALAQQ